MIEQILARAQKSRVPVAFVGQPGQGKTARIVEWARQQNLPCKVLLLSSCNADDIAGIVVKDGAGAKTLSPQWAQDLIAAGRGVLLLDELSVARRDVADAALTLVANRVLPNGDRLPPDLIICAAWNPQELVDGNGISPAMLDRFAVFQVEQAVAGWLNWARGKFAEWKVAMVEDAVLRGFEFSDEFSNEEKSASPRGLTNLLAFAESPEDLVRFAVSFIGLRHSTFFQMPKKNIANRVFDPDRGAGVLFEKKRDAVNDDNSRLGRIRGRLSR